jgi:hypothetical protein
MLKLVTYQAHCCPRQARMLNGEGSRVKPLLGAIVPVAHLGQNEGGQCVPHGPLRPSGRAVKVETTGSVKPPEKSGAHKKSRLTSLISPVLGHRGNGACLPSYA